MSSRSALALFIGAGFLLGAGTCPVGERFPGVAATHVVVLDLDTGQPVYQRRGNDEVSPLSLTKIATALVLARQKVDLAREVTVSPADVDLVPGLTSMGLRPGDIVTFEDLLMGVMLVSGGDASQCIARCVGDSMFVEAERTGRRGVERFVDGMNELAAELGLTSTSFRNAYGMDQFGHASSARDIALLAAAAFRDPVVLSAAGRDRYTALVRGPNARRIEMVNTSDFVEHGERGVVASKTGAWLEPPSYALATLVQGKRRLVIVTLGSPSDARRYEDQRALIRALIQ